MPHAWLLLVLQSYVSGSGDHCPSLPQVDTTLSPVRVQVKFSVEPSTDTLGTLLMVTPLAGVGDGHIAIEQFNNYGKINSMDHCSYKTTH